MRKTGWLMGLLLCAGCVTTELQYKEGITPLQRNRDITACDRQATSQHPVSNQLEVAPRFWVPARRHCNSNGCFYQAGHWSGGQVQTTDTAFPQRRRAFGQCMAQRGYQPVAATGCTGRDREAALRSHQGRYPRLTSASCTVGMSDGTLKVYTP